MGKIYSVSDEKLKCSILSPSIVDSNEKIIRFIFTPEHFDGETILPAAFSSKDLLGEGLSVQRDQYSTPAIETYIKSTFIARKKGRGFKGNAMIVCQCVRNIQIKNQRVLVILDDGIKNNCAHALILATSCIPRHKNIKKWSKTFEFKKIRHDLLKCIANKNEFIS